MTGNNDLRAGVDSLFYDRDALRHLPDGDRRHHNRRIRPHHLDVHAVGPALHGCPRHRDGLLQ
ncbi:MAG: hypothetical protein WAK85_12920, partial [Xanthobacteraceae bacterium]